MEIILVILAIIFVLAGVVGAVVPILPGPPLSFVALLLLWFCEGSDISTYTLVVMGILAVVVTILDFVAPVWLTNKRGGTKYGTRGATVGLIIGLFFGPLGLILGPFIGAFIGELLANTKADKAFGVAFMSFVAFMLTTGIKLIYSLVLLAMVFFDAWSILWN